MQGEIGLLHWLERKGLSVATVEAIRGRVRTRLEEAGVPVLEIGLRRPTMDDVFLSLTGRAAEADQKDEEVSR